MPSLGDLSGDGASTEDGEGSHMKALFGHHFSRPACGKIEVGFSLLGVPSMRPAVAVKKEPLHHMGCRDCARQPLVAKMRECKWESLC